MAENDGANLIVRERERQVSLEGWTPDHDDEHGNGELAKAARCYADHAVNFPYSADVQAYRKAPVPANLPWAAAWWKPKSPTRDLIRAGALIAAEIDRLQRAALKSSESH